VDPSSARDLIDGMERAREILGDSDLPSPELQSRVLANAEARGVEARWRRVLGDDGHPLRQAGIRTPRGSVWEDVTTTWEDAFRELGLL
jgi:hypothetical protein